MGSQWGLHWVRFAIPQVISWVIQWGSQLGIKRGLLSGGLNCIWGWNWGFPKAPGFDSISPQMNTQCTYKTQKSSRSMEHFHNAFCSMDGSNGATIRDTMRHLMGYNAPSEAAIFEGHANKMVTKW